MEVFNEYLSNIENLQHRVRTEEILAWVAETFSNLGHAAKIENI